MDTPFFMFVFRLEAEKMEKSKEKMSEEANVLSEKQEKILEKHGLS